MAPLETHAAMRLSRDRPVGRQPAIRRPFPGQLQPHGLNLRRRRMSRRAALQGLRVESGGGGIRTLEGPIPTPNGFRDRRIQPLCHPSRWLNQG